MLSLLLCTIIKAAEYPLEVPMISWRDIEPQDLQSHPNLLIGVGGFGDVYRALWRKQVVALKLLHARSIAGTEQEAFKNEATLMWQHQFPNILKLRGVCTEPGHLAMAFDLMPYSLHKWLGDSSVDISETQRLKIAADIARGLQYLHHHNIVHRDLKSPNILLDQRDQAQIADFGLAKLMLTTNSGGTATRRSVGTLRWKAPELLRLRPPKPDPSMDMYSYGMILWELVSRTIPFDGAEDGVVTVAVNAGEREEIPDDCPDIFRRIIQACWQKEPKDRPTADQVLAWLGAAPSPSIPRLPKRFWLPEEEPDDKAILAAGYAKPYPASRKDWEYVLEAYQHHGVPGYDVKQVYAIFNPTMNHAFWARMKVLAQRAGRPVFDPTWQSEDHADWRQEVFDHLAHLKSYQDPECPDVKILPLWHGPKKENLDSLFSVDYVSLGSTGWYFGNGIYAAHEASYAHKYASPGTLIFNWLCMYSGYPIILPDFDTTNKRLINDTNDRYDVHVIPVSENLPFEPNIYITPQRGRPHEFTEFMVKNGVQLLPRCLVTLQPILPSQMRAMYTVLQENLTYLEQQTRKAIRGEERVARHQIQSLPLIEYQACISYTTQAREEEDRVQQEKEAGRLGVSNPRLAELLAKNPAAKAAMEAGIQMASRNRNRSLAHSASALSRPGTPVEAENQRLAQEAKEQIRQDAIRQKQVEDQARQERDAARAAAVPIGMPLIEYQARIANNLPAMRQLLQGLQLIYKKGTAEEKVLTIPVGSDPLHYTFDLGGCGDAGRYLSIATGYRTGYNSANEERVEFWIATRKDVVENIGGNAARYAPILPQWPEDCSVGLIWNHGAKAEDNRYEYMVNKNVVFDDCVNLYGKWVELGRFDGLGPHPHSRARWSSLVFVHFYVSILS